MMTLIRPGGGGIFFPADALRLILAFFLVGAALCVGRFAVAFFAAGLMELFAVVFDGAAFAAADAEAFAGFDAAGVDGLGLDPSAGTPTADPSGATPTGADPSGATPTGATFPAETDVVVLLPCCVPFVAPNSPVMNGLAMQS